MEKKNANEIEAIDFWEMGEASQKEVKTAIRKEKKENIFDDFGVDDSLQKDVAKMEKKKSKDIFFYLSIVSKILQVVFLLLLFTVVAIFFYVYIQKNENLSNKSYLDPVCHFFIGDIKVSWDSCSSIASLKNQYTKMLSDISLKQGKEIAEILPPLYVSQNLFTSKEVVFLKNKTDTKLPIINIMAKFNYIKNEFTSFERKKIRCENFNIDWAQKLLKVSCSAYTRWYESGIIGFDGDKGSKFKVNGTSISLANSFINFIDKDINNYFTVVDRQKVFEIEPYLWDDGFTNKTNFTLTLKINF